jgi:hypothetical protein
VAVTVTKAEKLKEELLELVSKGEGQTKKANKIRKAIERSGNNGDKNQTRK